MSAELTDALAVLRVCAEHNDGAIAPDHAKALIAEVERLRCERDEARGLAKIRRSVIEDMHARLDKVRALHKPRRSTNGRDYCASCFTNEGYDGAFPVLYPCPTIQAIDGSDQ